MNLVTGASGIIGSHVAYALLKKGEAVIAIKRSTSNLSDIKNL
ncbi:MAG: GDP-mannose 4,6-dehydratase, partial [Bacteroidia bacterium]|nr:GDP-mannose 4,6-dehydratase [Bacteroidia bacterium]